MGQRPDESVALAAPAAGHVPGMPPDGFELFAKSIAHNTGVPAPLILAVCDVVTGFGARPSGGANNWAGVRAASGALAHFGNIPAGTAEFARQMGGEPYAPLVRQYRAGTLSPRQFAQAFAAAWGISPSAFIVSLEHFTL